MCRGMPGGMKNIVHQAGARRTAVTGLKNYNNNEFFLLSRDSAKTHTRRTNTGGIWPMADLGTTHTHRPPSPGPPEAAPESPTAPNDRYTHGTRARHRMPFLACGRAEHQVAAAGGGEVGDGGGGTHGGARHAGGRAAGAGRPFGARWSTYERHNGRDQ